MTRRRMRKWTLILAAPVLVLLGGTMLGCFAFSGPRHRGAETDHFDGRRFQNRDPIAKHGFGSFMRWMFTRDRGPWRQSVATFPGEPPPERVGRGELRVTFVNHATTLVQMDGINVLTDPIWSERASPVSWAGPKRMRPPGLRFEDLPPIDVVVVSHNHYDHMDLPTLERLARDHEPRFFVGLGNGPLLTRHGISNVEELDWWETFAQNADVSVTGVPAQHFSQRGLCDRNGTLWQGYVMKGPAGAVYFAGDTGWGTHFKEIGERFGPIRLAILPVGAFRPRWFMAPVHISPEEAVFAHRALGASTSVAIHFGTFALADDGQEEPLEALSTAVSAMGNPTPRFWVLGFGEGRDVPEVEPDIAPKAGNEPNARGDAVPR